jgi:hypothetical protein
VLRLATIPSLGSHGLGFESWENPTKMEGFMGKSKKIVVLCDFNGKIPKVNN